MRCPTPCVCGEIVELDEMRPIETKLPDGGNLVCGSCYCESCEGSGECSHCDGGLCARCGATCPYCDGDSDCDECKGRGYRIGKEP